MSVSAEENLKKATAQLEEIGETVNAELLAAVQKGLGIANTQQDASLVSATDQSEVDRVRTNYLEKKLGLTDDDANKAALAEVLERMKGFNQKQRSAVYYLLCVKFGKQDVYGL